MVENCIGMVGLPVGLGLNFVINGKQYTVPMAVEEPSIIAAASGAAQLVARNGGFQASMSSQTMIGQIHLVDFESFEKARQAVDLIAQKETEFVENGNLFC